MSTTQTLYEIFCRAILCFQQNAHGRLYHIALRLIWYNTHYLGTIENCLLKIMNCKADEICREKIQEE